MEYRCWVCGIPIEDILGYCSLACEQVYEHERREDILRMLPWEIMVEACNFQDKGYLQLYTILMEIADESDNWVRQQRLIGIIRYCRSKKLMAEKLEVAYHMLKQAESPHYNQKASQIWNREFLLHPDLEIDTDLFPLSILQHF